MLQRFLSLFFVFCLSFLFGVPPDPAPPTFQGNLLPIVLVNNTGQPDSNVYVVVTGSDPTTPTTQVFVSFDAGGIGTLVPAVSGDNASNYSKKFSDLPTTTSGRVVYIPYINSSLIYFSIANPLNMPVNGSNAIVQPDFSNPLDPNYNTIYDIFEFVYLSTPTQISADATAVSFFSLPIYAYISTPDINTNPNTGLYQPRSYIFSQVANQFNAAPASAQWNQLLLSNMSNNLRILSPGKAMTASPSLMDTNYLDNTVAYGYSYINDIWTSLTSYYRTNPLNILIPAGSFENYTGVINPDNSITFTSTPSNYIVHFPPPTTLSAPYTTTESIFSGLPLYDTETNPGDGVQVSKLLEEGIIAGLVPAPFPTIAPLSNAYLAANQMNFYNINPNLSPAGQTSGPWYDLYSKALHSLGFIYTFAFDEPLWPQVQISSQFFQPNTTYIGLTLGPLSQAASTTSVTSVPNPSFIGTNVNITATVSGTSGTPTGTVTFVIDNVSQPPVNLVNGVALLSTANLSLGSHTIVANYSGDENYLLSSGQVIQMVNKNPSSITLTSSANPSIVGSTVNITATVTGSAGVPTGSVTFSIDNMSQAPVPLVGGVAVLSTSSLTIGNHTITASYVGDAVYGGSESPPLQQTVNGLLATTTTLVSNLNPSNLGDLVTFTATVTGTSTTPTGTVTFIVDNVSGAPVPLVNGVALFSTSSLTAGSHSIIARYSGSNIYNSSQSPNLIQQVIDPLQSSSTTISSDRNPSLLGDLVTFTATVTGSSTTPTGNVTFIVDNISGAPVPLVNGVAAFSTSTLTTGSHTIVASYSGDGVYSASQSPVFTQYVVNISLNTTTSLDVTPNPSLLGETVTLTATVEGAIGTPQGTVVFFIDGQPTAPVDLVNGIASFSISSLGLGDHTIVAVYSGGRIYLTSTSSTVTQTVIELLPPRDATAVESWDLCYSTVILWKAPLRGEIPVAFEIYEDAALSKLLATVKNNFQKSPQHRFAYVDKRNLCHRADTYYIVSVDRDGNRSLPAETKKIYE